MGRSLDSSYAWHHRRFLESSSRTTLFIELKIKNTYNEQNRKNPKKEEKHNNKKIVINPEKLKVPPNWK